MTTTRTIMITGASTGIGEASAWALAAQGTHLLLNARDEGKLTSVAERVVRLGSTCSTIVGDVREAEVQERIASSFAAAGYVDGLVLNAGYGQFKPSTAVSQADFESIIAVNLTSCFETAKAAHPFMRQRDGVKGTSTIVLVGSDAGSVGFGEAAAYCASKSGLHGLGRALRAEWRQDGIRVVTVAPGRVDTHFNGKKPGMRPGALTPESVAEVIAFAIHADPILEFQEIGLDSMQR